MHPGGLYFRSKQLHCVSLSVAVGHNIFDRFVENFLISLL